MNIIAEIERVLHLESQAIEQAKNRLQDPKNREAWTQALDILNKTLDQNGKIIVTGIGKSGKIAQKIAATLSSTGSLAIYLHPTEGLHGDIGIANPQDSVLALSHSGNTEELIRLLPSLKSRKISIIGIGGNDHSKLAEQCDVWLDAHIEQEACPHNLAPTTSTTLSLAFGDALAVALMQLRGFDASQFSKNHPAGAIGKRLNFLVKDVMHSPPVVSPQATMDEVITLSTEKKLGGVIVTDRSELQGIITDGDIRRALKHKEKFFSLKAKDVMTSKPTTTTPETKAMDALHIMEKRSSQISVLPVVDSRNQCVGLLRLHDLLQSL